MAMIEERKLAIQLRKEGKTYNEIMEIIPIAKSTLSEWLKSVQLAKPQVQRITNRRIEARLRGSKARHDKRLSEIDSLLKKGVEKVGGISRRELWLIGVALYWAEGNKQRERSLSEGIAFGNTDPSMIRVFLAWLELMDIPKSRVTFDLYIHRTRSSDAETIRQWWIDTVGIKSEELIRIYFKKGKVLTKRTNTKDLYHGLLRIRVKTSTSLNREVSGYIAGIAASI